MDIKLRLENETTVKSAVGGCLSVLITALFLIITIYFGLEIVFKKEPIVRSYDDITEQSRIYVKDFPILLFVLLANGTNVVSNYPGALDLSIESKVLPAINGAANTYFEKLVFDRCQEKFMPEEHWLSITKTFNLDDVKCVNPFKKYSREGKLVEEDVYFENPYAANKSNFFQILIKKCDEKANPDCWKGLENVGRFFTFLVFPDTYQDLSDRENPIKNRLLSFTQQTSVQLYTRNYYEIRSAELISDNGWIFRDEKSQSFYQFFTDKSVMDLYNKNDRLLLNLTFSSSLMKKVLVRRYLKMPELFANIGGFIKAIMMCCQFAIKDYSTFNLYNQLNSSILLKENVKDKLHNRIRFTKEKGSEMSSVEPNRTNQEVRPQLPKNKEHDYMSYCYWIKNRFFKCGKSQIDLTSMNRYLDIVYIQQKRIENGKRLTVIEEKLSIS